MKLLHFLIIIIPVAISLFVAIFIIIPVTVFVQPLKATIIGYSVISCHLDPNNPRFSTCMTPIATTVGNNSYTLHQGDRFTLEVSVDNPNFFSIDNPSISTTFDRNAINYHYSGCGCCYEGIGFSSLGSTEIRIPNDSCSVYITNSTGKTNATVQIQYEINKKPYSVSVSQMITILPPSPPTINENYGTLSGNVSGIDTMPCIIPCNRTLFPSTNHEVDVYAINGTLVGKTFSDTSARYSIKLPAGDYTVISIEPHTVSVFAGKNTTFDILFSRGS